MEMDIVARGTYSYTVLATARSIRVMVLHSSKTFDQPLACDLMQVEIEACAEPQHEYDAVSYCWGEPNFSHSLMCNGEQLKITPNVDSLLRYLRKPHRPCRLWVDGICINQQDADEKSLQVALMGDIFFSAVRVHVWLGEAYESDDEAIVSLKRFAYLGNKGINHWNKADWSRLPQGKAVIAIHCLITRPWFSRRWVRAGH